MTDQPIEKSARLERVRDYARRMLTATVAHDEKHLERVRRWALRIAQAEGYPHLEMVQAAALLHDIGLPYVEDRQEHGAKAAEMASAFLQREGLFAPAEIDEIARAVRLHNTVQQDQAKLLDILRDADILDLLGAVGVMRAVGFRAQSPDFPADRPKGETWGFTARDFDARFEAGLGVGPCAVDQINFQISCYHNLATESARFWAQPLVQYMQGFLLQLEKEVCE